MLQCITKYWIFVNHGQSQNSFIKTLKIYPKLDLCWAAHIWTTTHRWLYFSFTLRAARYLNLATIVKCQRTINKGLVTFGAICIYGHSAFSARISSDHFIFPISTINKANYLALFNQNPLNSTTLKNLKSRINFTINSYSEGPR